MIRIKLPRVRAIDSEQLIIFAYCLLVVISILNTTQFGDIMGYHLIVQGIKYLCMALVFFAFWMRKNISPKTFLMAVILTAVGVGVALTSDRLSEVVLVIVFFVAGYNIKSAKILQRYLTVAVGTVLFTLILYALGIYKYDVMNSAGRVRRYLGFTYTTYLANYFFHFLLVYFVIRKRQITVLETAVILWMNWEIRQLTDTKAVYYEVILLLVLLWGYQLVPRIYQSWVFKIGTLSAMPILAALIIYLSYVYTPANIFLFSLNRLLTTRLSLGRQAISTYGFTLFGSETAWVTGRYGIERTEAYFYVDSSYLNIALSFGLVTLLLVMIGFYFLEKKALEEQKYILCIVLIMLAVHSFSDPQLFDLKYDPFLILIGTAILKKAPLPLKNPVGGGRSFAD